MDADWEEWFQGATAECKVWVEDPQKYTERMGVMRGEKSFLTYRIFYKQSGHDLVSVRHRFSEFVAMQKELVRKYETYGILVPQLPRKRGLSALLNNDESDAFIKERTYGLCLFCEAVVQNPFLRGDGIWKSFVNSAGKERNSFDRSDAIFMLQQVITEMRLPDIVDFSECIDRVKTDLAAIEKKVKVVSERYRALIVQEQALVKAREAFTESMKIWSNSETTSEGQTLNGIPPDPSLKDCLGGEGDLGNILRNEECPSTTASNATTFFVDLHDAYMDNPEYGSVLYAVALDHDLSQLEGLGSLLKTIEDMTGTGNTISAASTAMKHRSYHAKEAGFKNQEDIHRCFLRFTLPLFCRQRAALLRRAYTQITATHVASASMVHSAALSSLFYIKANAGQAIYDTCGILDLLGIKRLDVSCATDSMRIKPLKVKNNETETLTDLPLLTGLFDELISPEVRETLGGPLEEPESDGARKPGGKGVDRRMSYRTLGVSIPESAVDPNGETSDVRGSRKNARLAVRGGRNFNLDQALSEYGPQTRVSAAEDRLSAVIDSKNSSRASSLPTVPEGSNDALERAKEDDFQYQETERKPIDDLRASNFCPDLEADPNLDDSSDEEEEDMFPSRDGAKVEEDCVSSEDEVEKEIITRLSRADTAPMYIHQTIYQNKTGNFRVSNHDRNE